MASKAVRGEIWLLGILAALVLNAALGDASTLAEDATALARLCRDLDAAVLRSNNYFRPGTTGTPWPLDCDFSRIDPCVGGERQEPAVGVTCACRDGLCSITRILIDQGTSGNLLDTIPIRNALVSFLGATYVADGRGLQSLQEFTIANTQVSGSVPPNLGSLGSLTTLVLARNRLSAALPASLGSLAQLRYLDVQENALDGIIPASFGDLKSLAGASFARNEAMCGRLPPAWSTQPGLVVYTSGTTLGSSCRVYKQDLLSTILGDGGQSEIFIAADISVSEVLPAVHSPLTIIGDDVPSGGRYKLVQQLAYISMLRVEGSSLTVRHLEMSRDLSVGASQGRGLLQAGGTTGPLLSSSLTLEDCFIHDVGTTESGGAVFARGAQVTIRETTFESCTAGRDGGAVYAESAPAVALLSVQASQCSAGGSGGAFAFVTNACSITPGNCVDLARVTLDKCNAGSYGGAVYINDAPGTVVSTALVASSCSAGGKGGAVYVEDAGATVTFTGNTVTDCSAGTFGGAFYMELLRGDAKIETGELNSNQAGTNALLGGGGGGGCIAIQSALSSLLVTGMTFLHCQGGDVGGAIAISGVTPGPVYLISNTFIDNRARVSGGAVHVTTSTGLVKTESCFFCQNYLRSESLVQVQRYGGAMAVVSHRDGDLEFSSTEWFGVADGSDEAARCAQARWDTGTEEFIQRYGNANDGSALYLRDLSQGTVSISDDADDKTNPDPLSIRSTFSAHVAAEGGGAVYMSNLAAPIAASYGVQMRTTRFQGNTAMAGAGGAAYLDGVAGAVLIEGVIFEKSEAYYQGGALRVSALDGPSVFLLSCTFTLNHVAASAILPGLAEGGGAWLSASSVDINACTFSSCFADIHGGGVLVERFTYARIEGGGFTNSEAVNGKGGGMMLRPSAANLVAGDSVIFLAAIQFATNKGYAGAAAYIDGYGVSMDVQDAIFQSNKGEATGALHVEGASSSIKLLRCSFVNNTAGRLFPEASATPCGGAVSFLGVDSTSSITIDACIFTSNEAYNGFGGGLCLQDNEGHLEVLQSNFSSNMALIGGAISSLGTTVTPTGALPQDPVTTLTAMLLRDSNFRHNTAMYQQPLPGPPVSPGHGAALYVRDVPGGVSMYNCLVERNAVDLGSGVVRIGRVLGRVDVELCEFIGNSADADGAGLHLTDVTADVSIKTSTFTANGADRAGAIFAASLDKRFILLGCQFFYNTAAGDSGGAVYLGVYIGGAVTISGTKFVGNQAAVVGGIGTGGGAVFIGRTLGDVVSGSFIPMHVLVVWS
eukprot:jgi/Mesvir1/3084/Mv19883-RA.1